MSFGFSPGDVILVSTATFRFWRIIRDARAEQTNLTEKLDFLRQLVQRIDECATVLSPTLAPLIVQSVQVQLSYCLKLLNSLDETAMKYMIVSSSNCPRSKRPNLLRRGRWGMDKRDEFVRSLVELRDLTDLLMTYMMFEQLESKIQIPATPNHSFSSQAFRLIDALDQTIVCDMQLCDTWEGFEEYLEYRFKHSVGKSWVAARRFQITNETGGGILTAKEWKDTIKAGMIVSMAMVLQEDCTDTTEHACPSCKSPYAGPKGNDLERVKW